MKRAGGVLPSVLASSAVAGSLGSVTAAARRRRRERRGFATGAQEPAPLRGRLGAALLEAASGAGIVAVTGRDAQGRPSLRAMLTLRGGLGLWCVGGWLYTVLLERSRLQSTLGKVVFNARVERVGGGRVSTRAAAVRNALRVVDLLPGAYLTGLACCVNSPRRQRVGDRAASCMVVRHRFSPAARVTSLLALALPVAAVVVLWASPTADPPRD